MSNIWHIDRTLSGVINNPSQRGPGSYGNKEVHRIPQSSSITGATPLGSLVSYPGHLLEGVLPLRRDVFYNSSWLGWQT